MFRQHKIVCENKEVIIYLFLYDLNIDIEMIKTIYENMPQYIVEKRIKEYCANHNLRFIGKHIKIVYHSTIVRDFHVNQPTAVQTPPPNVISLNF
ncbi:MAG TPA: hypothetical protein DCY20_10875 [Firmicutes bacterium]|nr:hypothetical protein [Bacillota bacterium]